MYIAPAQNAEPSYMFEVSLNGLSVPLTSWWSLLITTGPYKTNYDMHYNNPE